MDQRFRTKRRDIRKLILLICAIGSFTDLTAHNAFLHDTTSIVNKTQTDMPEVSWDAQSLMFDGRRVVPAMGEVHYSRIPAGEWQREVRKMKEGGITMLACYVFWNHIEEIEGQYDWSGQRRLSFENIVFRGLNDTPAHMNALLRLLRGCCLCFRDCRGLLVLLHPDAEAVILDLQRREPQLVHQRCIAPDIVLVHTGLLNARQALWPPKPSESEIAISAWKRRALSGV